jgi:hypothetical protein
MATTTPVQVWTADVAMVFRSFIHEQLGSHFKIPMTELLIPFSTWEWGVWFPPSCICNVVDLTTTSEIRSLYPNTAKIIMHGYITDYSNDTVFEPSIYFVGPNNKRSASYIRQPTKEKLMEALKTSIPRAPEPNRAAPFPPHTRPLDGETQNGSMIQLLQKILEVCNRIDNKMKP